MSLNKKYIYFTHMISGEFKIPSTSMVYGASRFMSANDHFAESTPDSPISTVHSKETLFLIEQYINLYQQTFMQNNNDQFLYGLFVDKFIQLTRDRMAIFAIKDLQIEIHLPLIFAEMNEFTKNFDINEIKQWPKSKLLYFWYLTFIYVEFPNDFIQTDENRDYNGFESYEEKSYLTGFLDINSIMVQLTSKMIKKNRNSLQFFIKRNNCTWLDDDSFEKEIEKLNIDGPNKLIYNRFKQYCNMVNDVEDVKEMRFLLLDPYI